MNLIADTNVFLAVCLNEPEKERIIELSSGSVAIAPEILPYEIGNALSAMVKRRRLSVAEAKEAEQWANRIPVRLVSVDVQASLDVALEYNIYAYAAYFLHCARVYSCPLLTLDRRMKEVADHMGLNVLE